MFSPKRSRWPPIFFYISDITNSSSINGKIFRKNQCQKIFARTSLSSLLFCRGRRRNVPRIITPFLLIKYFHDLRTLPLELAVASVVFLISLMTAYATETRISSDGLGHVGLTRTNLTRVTKNISELYHSPLSLLRWFPSFALRIPTAHDFCVISARKWARAYKT